MPTRASKGKLDETLATLRQLAPDAAPTLYYDGVSALLDDRPEDAVHAAERSIAADPNYAPVYDLLGAAHTKLGHTADARQAFERSLSFDPHDSTAYTNLGLLALAERKPPGRRPLLRRSPLARAETRAWRAKGWHGRSSAWVRGRAEPNPERVRAQRPLIGCRP